MCLLEEGWQEISQQEWQTGKSGSGARHLLQVLLCAPQRTARRSSLIDDLWPEQELSAAEATLNKAASKLRSVLGDSAPCTLLTTIYGRRSYQLAGQHRVWAEVEAAEIVLNEAERVGRHSEQGVALLQEAVDSLPQGEFLAAEGAQWALIRRGRIETLRTHAHLWLADAYEQQGLLHRAEEQMEALLLMNPTDEAAFACLLTLLHQQDMKAQALRRYKDQKRYLEAQGMRFSPTVEALVRQIQATPLHLALSPLKTDPKSVMNACA